MTFNKANELLKQDIGNEEAQDAFSVWTHYHYCDLCVHAEDCAMASDMNENGETVAKCNFYEEADS